MYNIFMTSYFMLNIKIKMCQTSNTHSLKNLPLFCWQSVEYCYWQCSKEQRRQVQSPRAPLVTASRPRTSPPAPRWDRSSASWPSSSPSSTSSASPGRSWRYSKENTFLQNLCTSSINNVANNNPVIQCLRWNYQNQARSNPRFV